MFWTRFYELSINKDGNPLTSAKKMKAKLRDIFNMVLALFSIVLSIVFFIIQNACQN